MNSRTTDVKYSVVGEKEIIIDPEYIHDTIYISYHGILLDDEYNPMIVPKLVDACKYQIIFNASLATGSVPSDWRQANITPVFKKGERFKASNYRPVSLTRICSKLQEHIVVAQVMDHFDRHKILVDCQHGFRAKEAVRPS